MLRVLLLILLFANAAHAAEPDAQAVTTAFYDVYLKMHPMGVPEAKERVLFTPVISPALNKLLADGDKAETDYAKKTKNEVPPLVEGDLFTSNFEGVTSFTIGPCEETTLSAQCAANLVYVDTIERDPPASKPDTVKWKDTVFLIRTDKGWKVDDIAYGGDWSFGNHGRLKGLLADLPRSAKE
jgi:hypothetical protein